MQSKASTTCLDKMQNKITKKSGMFLGGNVEKCVHYVQNTLHCVEISTVKDIDNKAFPMYMK